MGAVVVCVYGQWEGREVVIVSITLVLVPAMVVALKKCRVLCYVLQASTSCLDPTREWTLEDQVRA